MKKIFYTIALLISLVTIPLSTWAQCPGVTRTAVDCKAGTINAIGWAMKNFFPDGSTSTWNWESGSKFVENTDGTADLTGVISHLGNPTTRRFQVNIHLIGQTYTAPPGSPVLFNTSPSIVGWYYYDWGASTLTGLNDLSGAKLTLLKRGKSLQVGTGAADQVEEIGKNGASGWFSWQIISQPSNNWLRINTFPTNPSVDEADICIALSGQPTNCNNPCDYEVTPPTITNCPTNIKLTTTTNCAITSWSAPTATDNCGIPSVSLTSSPTVGLGIGSCFPVGTTTLTYKATDAKGNSATCSFTVTVTKTDINPCDNDVTSPTITNCPININLTTTTNCAIAIWTAPTTNDNCGTPSVSITSAPTAGLGIGSCFPVGTTTLTYKATDAKGNSATCSFTVTVTTQGNNLDCNNVTVSAGNGSIAIGGLTAPHVNIQVYKVYDYGGWLSVFECVDGQCSKPIQNISSLEAANYKIFVTFFNDKWENVCTISKDVKVTTGGTNPCDNDVTNPSFANCPTNINITTMTNCSTATWTAPTAADNCSTPSVSVTSAPTAGLTSGSCFPVGTTTITYKATDAKGNMATCTFTVTVVKTNPCDNDVTNPSFANCPTNINITTATNCGTATWTAPTAADNCSTPSVSVTSAPTAGLTSGSCFPIGTTTINYKATDAKGNMATCSFTVTVVKIDPCDTDAQPPVLTACPANINLTTLNGCIIAAWTPPTASDNCGTPTISVSSAPTAGLTSGSCFPIGTTTVTYKASDAKGNMATCSFTVAVVKVDPCDTDAQPPVLTACPANINLTTLNGCIIAAWTPPTASDNCGTPTISVSSAPTAGLTSGSCFPIGTTTVTYKASDAKGNMATCSFTVAVVKVDPCDTDAQPPVLTACPANINLTTLNGCIIAAWTPPTASDNCGTPNISVSSTPTAGLTSGSCFPIGTTTVTYKASDAKGNMATCSFTVAVVKVDPCDTDAQPPVLTACPANINLTTLNGCIIAAWTPPTASDNCGTPNISVSSTPTAGLTSGSCFPIGTTTITYKATDAKGNMATCSFTVTVVKIDPCDTDTEAPIFSSCPENIYLSTTLTCATATWEVPTASDNCSSPSIFLTSSSPQRLGNGSCFPIGTTTLTYRAVDDKGNTTTCSFTVTVIKINPCDYETVPPIFTKCPSNINLTTLNSCAIANWTVPTAIDNCSTPYIVQTEGGANGSCFPIGTTTITYKATDAKGNMATCTFTVTVVKIDPCDTDAQPPVLTPCPANINLTTTLNGCVIASWTPPTASDNCGTPTISVSSAPTAGLTSGSCFPIGTTTITYKATDAKGNMATCTFTVTVVKIDPCDTDVQPPVLTPCPANINLTTTLNGCVIASWTPPTASDNCGTPTISVSSTPTAGLTSGSCFPIGTTTITYKATDAKGNMATCTFTVTVVKVDPCDTDAQPPVLTPCPANINLTTTLNGCVIASWTPPTASDNCGTPTISVSSAPTAGLTSGSCFPIGTTTITYKATDAKGNMATCSFKVKVVKVNACDNVTDAGTIGKTCVNGKIYLSNITSPSGGSGTLEYLWLKSTVGCPPNAPNQVVPNSNSPTLTVSHITQKTYYLRCVRRVGCTKDSEFIESNCIVVYPNSCASSYSHLTSKTVLTMEANAEYNRSFIQWVNNTSYKNDYFAVQKMNAVTGIFEDIEIINAIKQTDELQHFSTYDNNPTEGDNYYRIKLVYEDGKVDYSEMKVVVFKGLSGIRIFPNPSYDYTDLDLTKYKNKPVSIYLYNPFGQPVQVLHIEKVGDEPVRLDVSKYNSGHFLIRITSKGKRDVTQQLIITR